MLHFLFPLIEMVSTDSIDFCDICLVPTTSGTVRRMLLVK